MHFTYPLIKKIHNVANDNISQWMRNPADVHVSSFTDCVQEDEVE